jgi:hypothetical protein
MACAELWGISVDFSGNVKYVPSNWTLLERESKHKRPNLLALEPVPFLALKDLTHKMDITRKQLRK